MAFDPSTATLAEPSFDPSTAAPVDEPLDPLGVKQAGADAMAQPPSVLDKFIDLAKTPSPSWLQGPEQAVRGFVTKPLVPADAIQSAFETTGAGAVMPIARYLAPDNPYVRAASGVEQGAAETASGFTSPENMALLALAPESKLAQVGVAAGFEAQALSQFPALYRAYNATDDPQEKAKILSQAVTSAGIPAFGALHAAMRGKAANAPEIPQEMAGTPRSYQAPVDIPTNEVPSIADEAFARFYPQTTPVDQPIARIAYPTETTSGAQTQLSEPKSISESKAPPQPEPTQPTNLEQAESPKKWFEMQRPTDVGTPEVRKQYPTFALKVGNDVYTGTPEEGVTSHAALAEKYDIAINAQDVHPGYANDQGQFIYQYQEEPIKGGEQPDAIQEPTAEKVGAYASGDESAGLESQSERVGPSEQGQEIAAEERPVEPPPIPETPRTTGIAQHVHEERGLDVQAGEGLSAEEMVNRGRNLLDEGVNPDEVAARIADTRRISDDDVAVLRAAQEQLAKETNATEDQLRRVPNNPFARKAYEEAFKREQDYAQNVVKPAQTIWSNTGRAMQGNVDIDTGTFSGLRRAVIEEKGRDITPQEAPQLEATAKRVQAAQWAEAASRQALSTFIEKAARGRKPFSADELRNHFAEKFKRKLPC